MTIISDFTKHNLNEQGFDNLDDAAKSRYAWPLRFAPGVSIILVAVGLVWQSPIYLGVQGRTGKLRRRKSKNESTSMMSRNLSGPIGSVPISQGPSQAAIRRAV